VRTILPISFAFLVFGVVAQGCSSGPATNAACSIEAQTGCKQGQVCETVAGKGPACFEPVSFVGKVIDAQTSAGIASARVVARDPNGAAVSNVAVSAADGTYKLVVPAPRDADGKPVSAQYTLRADAQNYAPFPSGLRVALPIDVKTATGTPPIVQSSPTTIALLPLGKTGLGRIAGTVKSTSAPPGGTLVVAQGGATGIADRAGAFVVFNVEAGAKEVRGYASGVNLKPATANVVADQEAGGVDLLEAGAATASVTGSVNIVNAPGGSVTSVVLAVEDTFNANLERGDVPRGLRAGNVTGAFEIKNVPDGKYVVLAAFENDGLVRDPDPNIAGTQIPHITMAGAAIAAGNFKVTEALAVISPGANDPEPVMGNPTFAWKDDSSETGYALVVFDDFGTKVWEDTMIPSFKGSGNPTLLYAGPALTKTRYYQWRVTSLKMGAPISKSEELRGVFIAQ
jgi:hypothetical protein